MLLPDERPGKVSAPSRVRLTRALPALPGARSLVKVTPASLQDRACLAPVILQTCEHKERGLLAAHPRRASWPFPCYQLSSFPRTDVWLSSLPFTAHTFCSLNTGTPPAFFEA